MNGINLVFDMCVVVKLLKGEFKLSSLDINIDEARQFISVITRMELFAKYDMKPKEEQAIRNFIADITVFPLDEEVERKAVEIRRMFKIKLPDCIIAATAIIIDAVLVTNDQQLLRLELPGYKVKTV
jgi:predicted nucleic acid-binding protein